MGSEFFQSSGALSFSDISLCLGKQQTSEHIEEREYLSEMNVFQSYVNSAPKEVVRPKEVVTTKMLQTALDNVEIAKVVKEQERTSLIKDQDKAYEESLVMDRKKQEELDATKKREEEEKQAMAEEEKRHTETKEERRNRLAAALETKAVETKQLELEIKEKMDISKNVHLKEPLVYTVDNLLTHEECDHFIKLSKGNLKRALVSDNNKGVHSTGRTGSNYWIQHNHDTVTTEVGERIARIVGIPIENAEAYQVVYYDVSQEYRQHYDSFDHDYSEKSLRCLNYGGQRMATALCYLNTVEEGGGTRMTRANVDIKAEKGKLLIFWNVLDGTNKKHPLSEHAGMPVIKGEKYAFNLWFRECPRTVLYRNFNPKYYEDARAANEARAIQMSLPETKKVSNGPTIGLEVIDFDNNIYKLHNFLSENEISYIVAKSRFDNNKALPCCWIKKFEMTSLISKIENLCRIKSDGYENICVVKYSRKYIHKDHHDAYDLTSEKGIKHTETHGQRIWSVTGVLSDGLEYGFTKVGVNNELKKGDLIFYKNTLSDGKNRNDKMVKSIVNKSDKDVIMFNVYIREKEENKEEQARAAQQMESKGKCSRRDEPANIQEKNTEDYMKTYSEVLDMFKVKKIDNRWRGHKSFKIIGGGPPTEFLYEHVNRLIVEKSKYENGSLLTKDNLNATYKIDEFTPVIVNNVIEEEGIQIFKDYYREGIKHKYFPLGDNQSNRYKSNNEAFSRFLHYEILPLVEVIVGKKMKPSYSYLSAYTKGADLPAHTDRPECEYTVSYIVDKPDGVNWPIYFHKTKQPVKGKGRYNFTPSKDECVECDCNANGLMIFGGRDHIHFRERFEYDYYNILLLHFQDYNM